MDERCADVGIHDKQTLQLFFGSGGKAGERLIPPRSRRSLEAGPSWLLALLDLTQQQRPVGQWLPVLVSGPAFWPGYPEQERCVQGWPGRGWCALEQPLGSWGGSVVLVCCRCWQLACVCPVSFAAKSDTFWSYLQGFRKTKKQRNPRPQANM